MTVQPLVAQRSPLEEHAPHLDDVIRPALAKGFEFVVVSSSLVRPALNLAPFGHSVAWIDFAARSFAGWNVATFLDLTNAMNGVAFGPRGIPMPKWVMVDVALMPSAMMVATLPQDAFMEFIHANAPDESRRTMAKLVTNAHRSGYGGPIPVGGYCAAPSAMPGVWVGWSLWSVIPGQGLGLATKVMALGAYRATRLQGITQYDNSALRVHARLGVLRIVSAAVPVHNSRGSFVYESDLTATVDEAAEPTFLLHSEDIQRQLSMQAAIESGSASYFILPPGRVRAGSHLSVPILEVPATSTGKGR